MVNIVVRTRISAFPLSQLHVKQDFWLFCVHYGAEMPLNFNYKILNLFNTGTW